MAESSFQRARRRLLSNLVNTGWDRVRSWGAITPGTVAGDRFGSLGHGSLVGFPPSSLFNEHAIHIGEGTLVASWATLAAGYGPGQVDVPPRALVIGDRCVIGIRTGIVAHESIEIGDDVWFGQDIYVTDANHGFSDPYVPIGRQLGEHQPVRIGSGSWIGHGAVILPGVTVGRHAVIAAGSVVRTDVPDYAVVGGVPAKVLRQMDGPTSRTEGEAPVEPPPVE